MHDPLDIRLLRDVEAALMEQIGRAQFELGNGSQIKADAATTGMACANYIGEIKGLNTALKVVRQVHDTLTGKAETKRTKAA